MHVVATQRGYYGHVVRDPGDVFTLSDEAHFSSSWMKPVAPAVHPLDHDGDGRKGGSRRRSQVQETEIIPPANPAPAADPVTGDEI